MTPLAYIQQVRVERAKALLESSDLPVDAVSWKIGYEDAAFFNRLFKRTTGLTPGAYRRMFSIPSVD
jgi:transcriptional regulator GlxA family with amidase domain